MIFITPADVVWMHEQALASGAVAFLCNLFNDDWFAKTQRAVLTIRVAQEP